MHQSGLHLLKLRGCRMNIPSWIWRPLPRSIQCWELFQRYCNEFCCSECDVSCQYIPEHFTKVLLPAPNFQKFHNFGGIGVGEGTWPKSSEQDKPSCKISWLPWNWSAPINIKQYNHFLWAEIQEILLSVSRRSLSPLPQYSSCRKAKDAVFHR